MPSAPSTKTVNMEMDDFIDVFVPIPNHIDKNAPWNGCMFETYGAELDFVSKYAETKPDHVWTILEADGAQVISNGMHRVNRIGYLITEKAAAPNTFYDITDPDDVEEDEE